MFFYCFITGRGGGGLKEGRYADDKQSSNVTDASYPPKRDWLPHCASQYCIVFVLHEADSDGRASHTTIKNNFARTVLDGDGETATSTQEDRWPTLTTTSEIKAHRAVAKQFVEAKSLI